VARLLWWEGALGASLKSGQVGYVLALQFLELRQQGNRHITDRTFLLEIGNDFALPFHVCCPLSDMPPNHL
jgi:hypothetical protein